MSFPPSSPDSPDEFPEELTNLPESIPTNLSPDPYMTPAEARSYVAAMRKSRIKRFEDRVEPALAFVRDHWLAIINTILGVLIGVALVTPLAFAAGLTGPASAVFGIYRFFCAQTPSHSFFIAGYQVCLCSRCLAIYTSILAAGIVLALIRERQRVRPVRWYIWLLGMVPMALDGGTQLVGLRESNLALRLLTGAIFGVTTAWFLLPQIEEAATQEQSQPNSAAYAAQHAAQN